MPELEAQIAQWRQAMRAARIKSSVIDELEGHLREDLEQQMRSGTAAAQAFEIATRRMGSPAQLRHEFQKVPFKPYINMSPIARLRATYLLTVIALIAISVGLLLPAVAKIKAHEALAAWDIVICVVAIGAAIGGCLVATRMRGAKP